MISDVLRIGHRGAAGYAPENTLLAIEKGILHNCHYVEIDVQTTSDRQLVVMHDKRVDRTTNGQGYVSEMSFNELRRLDAGHGEIVPSLEEVLQKVGGRTGLMIELITPGIAQEVVEQVRRSNVESPILYASFLHHELIQVRRLDHLASTLALLEGVPIGGANFAVDAGVSHVGLGFDSVTPNFVRDLHLHGLNVFVYTLNDPRDIARARDLKADGIISDFPDRV
jgi:glycerophosphoryl diester phosphodiesterase